MTSLTDGDVAEENDTWLRVITSEHYWKKDGTLHNSAFSGGAIACSSEARPWNMELSGRLLSMVQDIDTESKEFCQKLDRPFVGLMFQTVENLSKGFIVRTGVYYTPNEDYAHSDFAVFAHMNRSMMHQLRDWLQDFIQCVKPEKAAVTINALRPQDRSALRGP